MQKIKNKKFKNIIITGESLFQQFGMKKVSIEEICKKSNVSKATFYKHFKNKNELIQYIFNQWFDQGYEMLDNINTDDIPFDKKIQAILDYKLQLTNKMSPQFIEEILHQSPSFAKFMTDYKIRNYTTFMGYIKNWQKKGDVRQDIKPEFFFVMFDKLNELTQNTQLSSLYENYTDYIKEVFNFFFYGVVPKKED